MVKSLRPKLFVFIIDGLVAIICLAGLYQLAHKAGIAVDFKYGNGRIVVNSFIHEDYHYLFHPGDIVVKVDKKAVTTLEDIEFILDAHAIGQQVEFNMIRDGRSFTFPVKLKSENSRFYLYTLFLVGTVFFALGLFVLNKRPSREPVATVFHWISITVCIHIMTTFGRYTIEPLWVGYFLRIIFLLASAFTPLLFIHLSFLFPHKKWPQFLGRIKWLYLVVIFYFFYLSLLFLSAMQTVSIESFHRFMISFNIGRWFFAASLVFGVGNFIHSYRTAREEAERRKLRWVILGLAIGPLSFISLWQIPQILTSAALVPEEVVLLISAITPAMFAMSIVRYHILDIDYIFNRSSVYFIVLASVIIVYTAIVATAAALVSAFTIRASLIISAFAAVTVALLFEPIRKYIQTFVDQKFFRVRYNYRIALRDFTDQINHYFELKTLASFVTEWLEDLLHPQEVAIYFSEEPSEKWLYIAGHKFSTLNFETEPILNYLLVHTANKPIANREDIEPGIDFVPIGEQQFSKHEIVLIIPLQLPKSQKPGFILLGRKKSATPYSFEDIDLLTAVAWQTGLAGERIRLQQNLVTQHQETQRLDELNRLKSYFVSSVSHDLQTPLTSIRMFAELLQDGKNNSAGNTDEYLEIIKGESERLSRLINNVLDFSRLERGVKTYHFEQVNLVELTDSVLNIMQYQLKQHNFEVEKNIAIDELIISADEDAITSALINLLSNAIKYSRDKKFISISIFTEKKYAVIKISDAGIGIPVKEQERIFDTFYRSADRNVQSMGGAGLGLTLVKHIALAHNGKITVRSKKGQGSSFSLYLPTGGSA